MKLKVGDQIRNGDIVRQITEVRKTGYTWFYVGDEYEPEHTFMSENSNDPFFFWNWSLVSEGLNDD